MMPKLTKKEKKKWLEGTCLVCHLYNYSPQEPTTCLSLIIQPLDPYTLGHPEGPEEGGEYFKMAPSVVLIYDTAATGGRYIHIAHHEGNTPKASFVTVVRNCDTRQTLHNKCKENTELT